jgi:DNA mismatch repair protein MutS2
MNTKKELIMDVRTLEVLEYNKVIQLLIKKTNSPFSRELALELKPIADFAEVEQRLAGTTEARSIIRTQPVIPLGGMREIRPSLRRAEIGAVLDTEELLAIANTLYAMRRLKRFLAEMEGDYVQLKQLGEELQAFSGTENAITTAIREQGDIADEASVELMRLRRERRSTQQRVRERLEGILRSAEYAKMIQEAIVTIRDDRYVIPIKHEYRGQFPGIIHDQSSSGATLYIEPLSVLDSNNELKQIAVAEETEIQRILAQLSGLVARDAQAIGLSFTIQGNIDFAFAKAKLAEEMGGEEPRLNRTGYINIKLGRHPLIQGEVVPTSIHLGKDFTTLVITGPNTGGKTVTLKTVGLFVLMTQAGLHVPAGYGTEIGIFHKVFADIGDEQSIEQSLSTFSSHMTNLVRILGQVDQNTLVLTDELGAGTDPTEGAALAMAILEYTHSQGARTIATTHYSELKTFAYNREGVENASVEFDVETLRPTYRLLIGMPGRSNAFEIAGRLGLSNGIIDRARALISEEQMHLEELLGKLAETRSRWEEDRRVAADLRQESERVKEEFEKQRHDLEQREKIILDKARQQALDILTKAKKDAEEIIGQLKTVSRLDSERTRQDKIHIAREKMKRERAGLMDGLIEEIPLAKEAPELAPGETVYLPQFRQKGHVVSPVSAEGNVVVQVGIMKVTISAASCQKVADGETGKKTKNSGIASMAAAKAQQISTELDIRGTIVDEALETVEKYLDDALLSGIPRIYVIHGKGTGALRKAVREYLAGHPRVASYRLGGTGEGGDGVTVVELK